LVSSINTHHVIENPALKNKKTPHTAGEIPKKKSYIKIVE
jgi:hypothetical protein